MNFRLPKTSISGLLLSAALITAAALPLQGQSIPTISNITPSTVSPGDTITITGTSFCTRRPQQTSVTFGAIKGTVLSLSATSIQAQVPAGAVSGSVVVRSCRQTSTGYPITVGSVVTPPTVPPPTVTPPTATGVFGPSSTLQLDKTIVTPGQTLYAIVTYTNSSSSAVTINNLVIASRPPVSTKAGGPYMDLSPIVSVTTVQPGATIQLSASRAFTTSDPPGMWSAYSTWQDSALVWYDDGPTLDFTVSASSTPTPSTTPVVDAGPDLTITLPSTAGLNGTATGFPAGSTLTQTWSKVSGTGTVSFSGATLATTATFSTSGSYTLRLTVSGGGVSSSNDAVITVNPAPPPTSGLSVRVVGNKLVNGSGQTIRLLGVNVPSGEYACVQGWGFFTGPTDATGVQAIKNWNVNTVRLPMNEDCWLGINGVSPTYASANYQNAIKNYVSQLHQAGIYVVLDLQWNAPGTTLATNIGYMADRDHALDFWTSVANFFKNDPAVIFDLFNEPHDISDACWRDGCTTPGGWQAVGMQTLINTIRATGATQPILVSSNGWGNGGIPTYMNYRPSDPLNSLIASVHIYGGLTGCTDQNCWDTYLKPMAAAMPLVSGEFGETDCAQSFVNTYMTWLDSIGAGYLAWGWYTASCGDPSLIVDYSGTPTAFGVGVRAHLLTQTVVNSDPGTPILLAREPFADADRGTPLNPIISSLEVNTAVSALAGQTLEPRFREIPRLNLLAQEPFAGADRGTPLNSIVSPLEVNTAVSALAGPSLDKYSFGEMHRWNSTDRFVDFLETLPYLLPRTLRSGRTRQSSAVRL